ncbi:MAG: hypothetical protein F4146_02355, partial [Rhodothermaceae bacterium]|nr:hypothetical protein [Rhodothermaceae bacterium]
MPVKSSFHDQENIFSFWPRHNETILKRLESKDAWLSTMRGTEVSRVKDALEHEMTLNIGPQHPATHGVLRCMV